MVGSQMHTGRVDDYEFVRRVAVGAMSEVYEGRRINTGQPVAIKILHEEWCASADLVARFCNEATTLAALRHPHIVEVLAQGRRPGGAPFMVLEWLPCNLDQALGHAGDGFLARVAVRIAAHLGEAVLALHDRGIVHRDLKPANVLLSHADPATAMVKLADLGLAKMPQRDEVDRERHIPAAHALLPISTGTSALLGTWDYMAPELWIRAKDAEPGSDVYALGVLLFQMLAGRLPFAAEHKPDLMRLHLFHEPPLHLLDSRVDPTLRQTIADMLHKKPSRRLTIREAIRRLEK